MLNCDHATAERRKRVTTKLTCLIFKLNTISMKKVYFLLLFLSGAFLASAQVEVTFSVDMNEVGASSDGVFITGDWMDDAGFGGEWQEPGSNASAQMEDANGDGLYQLTVTLPAGDYVYKYANGSSWANGEAGSDQDNYQADLSGCGGVDNGFGGWDRTLTVPDQSTFVPTTYEFNSCTESSLTSISEISTIKEVTIAPNPATDRINVTYSNRNATQHTITISSLTGQMVKQFPNFTGDNITIQTSDLSAGIYFLSFTNQKGEVGTKRFIVQ